MTITKIQSPVIYLWLMLLLLVPFMPTLAASFDCNKASTLVETAICSDAELSSLDDSLAALYKQALRQSSSASQIKARQRAWLKTRNTCKSEGCVRDAYHQRLAELQATPAARPTQSAAIPVRIGDCVTTQIEDKSTRFAEATPGDTGGEMYVSLTNSVGLYLTNIPHLPANANPDAYMARTRDFAQGDTIRLCLISLPEDCPPGDDRGKSYSVTNLKNQLSFIGIDAWHTCGGA